MTFPEAYAIKGKAAFKDHPDAKNWGFNVSYLTGKRLYRFFVDHNFKLANGDAIEEWKLLKETEEKLIMAEGGFLAHKSEAWEFWYKNLPAEVQNTEP